MGLWRGAVAAGVVLGLGGFGAGRVEAQRLPGGVRPVHYSLTITPDLGKATFAGSETIEVVLAAPTKTITLNAAEIEFGAVRAESREQGTGNSHPSEPRPLAGGPDREQQAAAGAKADSSAPLRNDKQKQKTNAGILHSAQNDKQDAKATTEILSFAQNDASMGNDRSEEHTS